MQFDIDVYIIKGVVRVPVDAKNIEEAERKAIKEVEQAETGFHGNYPKSDKKYLAFVNKNINKEVKQ